jgi:hypothetical protein
MLLMELFGQLNLTSLSIDDGSAHPQIELKYKGRLNTATGDWVMRGHLRKNLQPATISMQVS